MAVFLTAMSLPAATSYGFSVGGVSVTSDNCNSVTGSNITGTVKYTPSTNTLTLTNVTITRSGYCIYNESCTNLKVEFVGTCNLTDNNAPAIKSSVTTTFTASTASTVVNLTGKTSNGEGIYIDGGSVYIYGPGTFNLNSNYADALASGNGALPCVYFGKKVNAYITSSDRRAINGIKANVEQNSGSFITFRNETSSYPVVENTDFWFNYTSDIVWPLGSLPLDGSVYLNGDQVKNKSVVVSEKPSFCVDGIYYRKLNIFENIVEVCSRDEQLTKTYSGSVSIPSTVVYDNVTYTVTGVGKKAFYACGSLNSCTLPNTVETLGDSTYYGCYSLSSINIPNSVTSIGSYAFYNCYGLANLTLGSGLKYINDYAFAKCEKLTNVVTPSSIIRIGANAFADCSQLSTITIGSGCTSIGDYVLSRCTALTKITCQATTPPSIGYYTFWYNGIAADNYNVPLWVPNSTAAIAYHNANYWKNFNTIIPQSSISNVFDFYKDGIYYHKTGTNTVEVSYASGDPSYILTGPSDYLNVPQTVTCNGVTYTVTGVRDYAFQDCQVTNGIQLPPTVTSIGTRAFNNCQSDVIVTGALTYLGKYAFSYCTTSETLYLNIDSIPSQTCYYCTNLSSIRLGDKVKYIESYAFYNCPLSLIDCVSLPNPPTVQSSTFSSYTATVRVPSPGAIIKYKAADYWKNFTNYQCWDDYDFVYNGLVYAITSMGTTNTVKVVGCNKTGAITIPSTVPYQGVTYNVTEIGDRAFWSYEPDNKLRSPGNSDYTSIYIPNSVTTIGSEAFGYCEGLTQITIPSSVTSIGSNAFVGCSALTKLTSNRTTPPTIQSNTFENSHYQNVILTVPSSALYRYRNADNWRNFYLIFPSGVNALNYALNEAGTITFASTGDYPWIVKGDGTRIYAQSSNAGVDNSSSVLTANVNVNTPSTLSFDFKAWGEGTSYDKCIFSVDGTQKFSYGARDNDWETYSVELSAGTHTLTWTYTKDGNVNPTGDYFAVDNVNIQSNYYEDCIWNVSVEADAGSTVTIPVYFSNSETCRAYIYVNFTYPEGFEVVNVEEGDRFDTSASLNTQDQNGVFSFLYMNMNEDLIEEPGSGVLAYLTVNVPATANGEYEMFISGYYNCYGSPSRIDLDSSVAIIRVNGSAGDVNGDGVTNISDVTALINYLLSGGTPSAAADVNGDGKISIADVTELINMLLSNN